MERDKEAQAGAARLTPPPEPEEEPAVSERAGQEDEEHKIFGLGIGTADTRQPAYGQGVVVSLLVAAGLLILGIIAIGKGNGKNPPLQQTTDAIFWLISVVVLLVAGLGAQYAERTATQAAAKVGQPRPPYSMATAWTVPVAAAFAGILLIATYHNRSMLLIGPLIGFLGTAGALLSRDLLDDADEQSGRVASTIHTLVIHAVAFLALSSIYLNKLNSWVSAPLAGIIAGILVLETLERGALPPPTRVVYAVVGGWAIAQVTVALNWWPSYGWSGGAVLLVAFYVAAGLLLARAQRAAFGVREALEFGALGFALLLFLAVTA